MPSSRLARRESQKMLKQTIYFVGGTVALILAFIFVVLPLFVRLMTGTGSVSLVSSDTTAPQLPVLVPPPDATPSASLTLRGFGESNSMIVLVLNGSQQGETSVSAEGQFTLDVPLEVGENALAVFAKDDAKNESQTTLTVFVTRDDTPPTLEISEPSDGQQIELRRNQVTTIKGKTEPDTQVSLNGRRIFSQIDGTFTSTFQLTEGENKLQFEAIDKAGNTTRHEITVKFRL